MPTAWFAPEYAERRYRCRVPANLTFQTKNELARAMLAAVNAAGTLDARCVTMDEAFSKDRKLFDRIADQTDYLHLAEVPTTRNFG